MKEFRKLRANEIDCKTAKVNKGGVQCLLWKNKFATTDILDEACGKMNWDMSFANAEAKLVCSIRVYDEQKGQWVSRVGIGEPSNYVKCEWNDAISAAGTSWGIGRELYSAPEIFFPRSELKNYSYDENERRGDFYDLFKVESVSYQGDVISDITISVINCKDHKIYLTKTFVNESLPVKQAPVNAVNVPLNVEIESVKEAPQLIPDDEIILIGNCKGKRYGDVKDTALFKSFLNWTKTSTTKYNDAAMAAQLLKFKSM